jgi:transposase
MFSCAGIDVAKDTLEIRINPQDVGASFSNSISDFPKLIDWFNCYKVKRVLLEATGGYEREVMKALQAGGSTLYESILAAPRALPVQWANALKPTRLMHDFLRSLQKS